VQSTLAPAPKLGKDGTNGLKFMPTAKAGRAAGWNWFGWWPETAGTDFRPYTHLTLWIKVTPKTQSWHQSQERSGSSLDAVPVKRVAEALSLESTTRISSTVSGTR